MHTFVCSILTFRKFFLAANVNKYTPLFLYREVESQRKCSIYRTCCTVNHCFRTSYNYNAIQHKRSNDCMKILPRYFCDIYLLSARCIRARQQQYTFILISEFYLNCTSYECPRFALLKTRVF